MTIKELFKKIEAYNEVTQHLTSDPAVLYFQDRVGNYVANSGYFETRRDLARFVRENYAEEISTEILYFDGYEFDEDVTIDTGRMTATVCFAPAFKNHS